MAIMKRTNSKVIKDPLFTPVIKYLKQRIADLEIDDPNNELELARQRYTGLIAGDLVIEDPVSFPDGIVRVCIVSRKTGFARADVEVKRVTFKEILEDFAIPFVEINSVDELKAFAKAAPVEEALMWLTYKNTYGVMLNQENAKTMSGMQKAFGGMFFNTYTSTRESLTAIDYDTLESGTVKITDDAFGMGEFPLFIYELVKAEADLPEITSNLPTEITTSRGKDFSIPNTYWFGGIEDITQTAQIDITTDSGYTIPRRSDDKLFLEGETIFGDAEKEVTDFIVVRVTHMYMGRPVKKTFRIKVIIEKDEQLDLTFVVTPSEITAARGDIVEVNVKVFFQGNPVTLNIPAQKFESKKHYGDLTYVETLPDGSMTYRGTITGYLPGGWDKDTELYKADFQYTDSGTLYRAPAYVNMIVVKPEAKPTFQITSVMTNIRGFKDEEGLLVVQAVYGKPDEENPQVVSPKELGITLGLKGTKGLIEFLEVTDDGIKYQLKKDSGVDGQSILDDFDQIFTWVDPKGVRYSPKYKINVEVRRKSVYEIVPGPSPLFVKRYQSGGPVFKFMMNGSDQTNLVTNLSVVDDNGYIYNEPKFPGQWRVLKAETDKDTPVTVKFEFHVVIDGINTKFEYEHPFVVYKYKDNTGGGEEPGENTKVVAVPPLLDVTGKTDETGKHVFQVFEDGVDISDLVGIVDANTSIPEQLKFNPLSYDPATGLLTLDYTKVKAGEGNGRIAYARKTIVSPLPEDRAVTTLKANIEQSRTFKVVSWPTDLAMMVEEEGQFKPVFEFAGVNVPLNDPQLKITKTKTSDVDILSREVDHLRVIDNFWRFVGRTYNVGTELTIEYTDPLNPAYKFKQALIMGTVITFPPLVLEYDKKTIDTKIWETGTFPIKLMAGTRDFTSSTTRVTVPGGNRYINVAGYNWNVVWAEKTAITTTVPLVIDWTIGESKGTFNTDAVFNLEAWDQITFGIEYDPHTLDIKSGDTGEITATFVYKGQDYTDKVQLVVGSSTIPETFEIVGTPAYDAARKLFVINYKSKRGGDYPMTLVFKRTDGPETINAVIDTKVQWPDGLNVVTAPDTFKGFYKDQVTYPLVLNISGRPIELTSANLNIVFSSGNGSPITQLEMHEESLLLSLDEGGDEDTNYDYPCTLDITWTDVATGNKQTVNLTPIGTIRISKIIVGENPVENVKVYDYGDIHVKLTDERGQVVDVAEYLPRGTNPYVAFEGPHSWYVTQGSESTAIEATLPLTLRYDNGGLRRSIDVSVLFKIARFDGIDFKGIALPDKLEGKAGLSGDLHFMFTYKGKPYTSVIYDDSESVMPKNLSTLPFDPDSGIVGYTLVGQATDTAKFVFKMDTAGTTPVEGKDQVTFNIPVKTTSSDEVFTLVSHGDKTEMFWKGRDLLQIALKYGEYDLPANAPGLKYTITGVNGAGDKYVAVVGQTRDGIYIRGDRSNAPGVSETFTFKLDIAYEVGAPTPKTATFNFTAKITMGQVEVYNTDERVVNIWDLGSFWQALRTPESSIPIDHFELVAEEDKYIEVTQPRGYEVIGAEPTTSTQAIKMKAFYKVDAITELQSIDFNANFRIIGSTSVRFKVIPTPTKIETGLDVDTVVNFRPVYKDKNVGGNAIFKQELSTIPPQVEVKEHRINGILHEITFTGKKGGIGETKLVFWSPDAGTNPKPRDVVTVTLDTRVLGELVLEVGDRDNLITGTHKDTGTYKLQLMFGLLPMDIADEISKGNLTITRETGSLTQPNAFVLNPKTWHAESFDYELFGPVAPGQTVSVSDFLNVTYRFGGNNYTRRIEIPLSYTTPSPVAIAGTIVGSSSSPEKMWTTRTLSPQLSCADTVITSAQYPLQRLAYTDSGKGKYVWIVDPLALTASVEGSEPTGLTNERIPFRFFATYRNWEYQTDVDFLYTVAAWDGKTFYVKFVQGTENVSPNIDTDFVFRIQQFYRGVQIYTDLIDYDLTDFGELIRVTAAAYESFSGSSWTKYTAHADNQGKKAIPITFRRVGGDKPGVLNLDYDVATLTVDVKVPALTISGFTQPVLGGNLDKVSAGVPKVTLAGTNIPINDPNLVIKFENEDAIKLYAKTANSLTYEVTAPLTTAIDAILPTKLTFEYTHPTTGRVHTGEFVQNLKYRLPDDYPKVTPAVKPNRDYTRYWVSDTLPFDVVANGASIIDQVQFIGLTPLPGQGGWVIYNPDFPTDPNRIFYVDIPRIAIDSPWRDHTFTFKAPFRGTQIDFTYPVQFWWKGGSSGPLAQFSSNPTSFTVETPAIGDEFEIPFKLTMYGKPYMTGYFSASETKTANLLEDFSKYFDYVSTRYDTASGTTYLKVRNKVEYNGVMNFVWYTKSGIPEAEKVDGVNRTKPAVTIVPGISIVPTPVQQLIFRRYNLPFKVMSGPTDITPTDVQLISVTGPNGVIYVNGTENPKAQARINLGAAGSVGGTWGNVTFGKGPSWGILEAATTDSEMEFTFKIRTSVAYGSRDITVVQKVPTAAWDQVMFKLEAVGTNILHSGFAGVSDAPIYDQDGNLVLAFPYEGTSSANGTFRFIGRALNWQWFNTLVSAGTPTGTQSLSPDQGLINSSSDGIMSWVNGGGNFTETNVGVKTNKLGEKVGQFGVNWNWSSGQTGNINDYPVGTLHKNRDVIPVKYIAFEPKLSWKDNVAPAPVTGKFGDTVIVQTNGLMFGPIRQVDMKGVSPENVTITPGNINIASVSLEPTSRGKDFFALSIRYNNTGTDYTADLPITITWRAVTGRTYTLDYIQKVIIKGTGTTDPVPTIVEITPQSTKMYANGANAGFKVSYNGQVTAPTYTTSWFTKATVESQGYIELFKVPNTIWSCVNADPAQKVVNVKYMFDFTDGVRIFPMEAVVPFTIAAWDGAHFVASNVTGPAKLPIGGAGYTDFDLSFEGTVISPNTSGDITKWTVKKEEFETLNPKFKWVNQTSSGNKWRVNFTCLDSFRGKVKIPVHYVGPGAATPPGQDKINYTVIEIDYLVYELKPYFFPDDQEPAQITGESGRDVIIPINMTCGLNVSENMIRPSDTFVTWDSDNKLLLTKSSSNHTTATNISVRIVYENRGEDIVIEVPLWFRVTSYNGSTIPEPNTWRRWNQKVLVKGTGTGDTTVAKNVLNYSTTVWQRGNAPFDLEHNGKAVALNQYKSITVKPNPYVRTPAEYDPTNPRTNVWEVYNGETEQVVTDVTYVVVFTDGLKDITFEVTNQFTIAPYDGIDFKVNLYAANGFNNGMATTINGTGSINLVGTFRGVVFSKAELGVKYGFWDKDYDFPGHQFTSVGTPTGTNSAAGDVQPVYTKAITDMPSSKNGHLLFGLLSKKDDPTAVEGRDFVKVTVPCYSYDANRWYLRDDVPSTTSITGRYSNGTSSGTRYRVNYKVRKGIINNNSSSPRVSAVGNDGQGFIDLNSNTMGFEWVEFWFVKELTTAPVDTRIVTFRLGEASGQFPADVYGAVLPVTVSQISNLTFPVISDVQDVTASIGDHGPVPFKVMAGTTDYTSKTKVVGVSDNPYITALDGEWVVSDAPAVDTDITVTLKVEVQYDTGVYPMEQDVKFTLKGSVLDLIVTDVQSVDGKVWDKGTVLPFKVKTGVGGNEIPPKWITGIALASPNNRVTGGPLPTNPWKIVAGDKTQAVTEEVTYSITVNTGKAVETLTQKVLFNIEKYDGVEFEIYPVVSTTDLTPLPEGVGIVKSNTSTDTALRYIHFVGKYRGDVGIPLTNVDIFSGGGLKELKPDGGGNGAITYSFTTITGAHFDTYVAPTLKRVGATGNVAGVDTATIKTPVMLYSDGNYLRARVTTEVDGKFGDQIDFDMLLTSSAKFVDLKQPLHTVVFAPNDVIEMVPGSLESRKFKVQFKADVDKATQTTVKITVTNDNNATLKTLYDVTVTQQPATVPEIKEVQDVTAKIFDKGPLPFKVMYKGNDITSECTLTSISANSYIRQAEGNTWEVYDAATAETTVLPEFTVTHGTGIDMVTLKTTVKFTVKGWNGKLLKPVGENSVGVIGKTGQIHIGGSFGDGSLYPDTTVDVASVNGKGIITVTKVEKATDDGLLLTYTGDAVGKEDITIRVKAIVDSGNAIEGSDFADVTVNVQILPATLTPSADFETDVIGDVYHPATVKQSVSA